MNDQTPATPDGRAPRLTRPPLHSRGTYTIEQPLLASDDKVGMLDYEKLDVYRCAIEHPAFVFRSIPAVPRGYSALADQWRRVAMSVPLNIAEAVGKTSDADRNNRYAIARGEAMGVRRDHRRHKAPERDLRSRVGRGEAIARADCRHAQQDVPLIVDVDVQERM